MHSVVKTYGHDLGLSACFRQWRADSHCRVLHGYALSFALTFKADILDENGWVIDFGCLKPVKQWLTETFDHKTLVAGDDPMLAQFKRMHDQGLADVMVLPHGVGCERFAERVYRFVEDWLADQHPRVRIAHVRCSEHGANAAGFGE